MILFQTSVQRSALLWLFSQTRKEDELNKKQKKALETGDSVDMGNHDMYVTPFESIEDAEEHLQGVYEA